MWSVAREDFLCRERPQLGEERKSVVPRAAHRTMLRIEHSDARLISFLSEAEEAVGMIKTYWEEAASTSMGMSIVFIAWRNRFLASLAGCKFRRARSSLSLSGSSLNEVTYTKYAKTVVQYAHEENKSSASIYNRFLEGTEVTAVTEALHRCCRDKVRTHLEPSHNLAKLFPVHIKWAVN
ncbi:hypothetical protein P171DRAFT_429433 [Karstenula rhodostoma CBS 690.94]|uniref:Uncharacterized protein n=1 Tax=Karstenula rhodostoma CBS 690.94 TaxID=1392251 RepID=A0A9P4UEU4_9PLEO|nr:hypothetical protein P171DRAFT_429433 [Karstenula rhodostoma CBS 690.94]